MKFVRASFYFVNLLLLQDVIIDQKDVCSCSLNILLTVFPKKKQKVLQEKVFVI